MNKVVSLNKLNHHLSSVANVASAFCLLSRTLFSSAFHWKNENSVIFSRPLKEQISTAILNAVACIHIHRSFQLTCCSSGRCLPVSFVLLDPEDKLAEESVEDDDALLRGEMEGLDWRLGACFSAAIATSPLLKVIKDTQTSGLQCTAQ